MPGIWHGTVTSRPATFVLLRIVQSTAHLRHCRSLSLSCLQERAIPPPPPHSIGIVHSYRRNDCAENKTSEGT